MRISNVMLTAAIGSLMVISAYQSRPKRRRKKERHVRLDELPAAVRETILRTVGGTSIEELEAEEKAEGTIIYEAEWHEGDKEHEIEIAADGTLLSHEVEISIEALPAAIQQTIRDYAGGAEIEEVNQITRDGRTYYKAEWKAGGTKCKMRLSETGEVLRLKRKQGA